MSILMECEQSVDSGQHKNKSLGISKDSHKIRKSYSESLREAVHPKRPVIVHIYTPKVIQIDPGNFMWLVQSLTGSSDTRSRCRKRKSLPASSDEASDLTAVAKTAKRHSDTSDGPSDCSQKLPSVQTSIKRTSSSPGKKCGATHRSSLAAAMAMAECAAKDLVSPRGPLPVEHDSLFSIPPVPAFNSSCFDLNCQVSQPSLLSSRHLPDALTPDAFNESLINFSCPALNQGQYIYPFKGGRSGVHNLLSHCIFQQTPTWDGRITEQLVSSSDDVLSNLGEGYLADTIITRRSTY